MAEILPTSDEFWRIAPEVREAIRVAIRECLKANDKFTVERVRRKAKTNQNVTALLVRLCKQSMTPPTDARWDGLPERKTTEAQKDLALQITHAKTEGDRARVLRTVAAGVAAGEISGTDARALKELLSEARQTAKAQRENAPAKEEDRVFLVNDDAVQIAQAYEGMIDDTRRLKALDLVLALAAEDAEANPNLDTGL